MENNNSPFIEITDLVKKFGTFTDLNGVFRKLPFTFLFALVGALSIASFPFTF